MNAIQLEEGAGCAHPPSQSRRSGKTKHSRSIKQQNQHQHQQQEHQQLGMIMEQECSDPSSASSPGAKLVINTRAAHMAGLKRLSERANSNPTTPKPASALSTTAYGTDLLRHLRSLQVRLDPGLTDDEVERIQATFRLTFPPDLRGLLQQGVPVGPGFPDWRSYSHMLKLWISLPKSALSSAAELGAFWWRSWGVRPADSVRAADVARSALRRAPVLIPLYGRCFLPASPVRAGNPVLYVEPSGGGFYYCARDISEFFNKECFQRFIFSNSCSTCSSCTSAWDTYVPATIEVASASSGLESARRMIERCASSVGDYPHGESDAGDRRSSSISARSVLVGGRASSSYGSRSSDGSDESGGVGRLSKCGVRRIEFWSELVEKNSNGSGGNGNNWSDSLIDFYDEDGFVQVEDESEEETDGNGAWGEVKEGVREMTEKLRNAGWKDSDVAEIMESCEKRSLRNGGGGSNGCGGGGNRESVLEGLASQLDLLSTWLREAGWSFNDITESLCLDLSGFSEHPSRGRVMREVSPQVASRIGVLAAFVAQG